ncbi:MAG: metallopeptidase family protein [Chloroflexi bacterium]|nr:metallopeptidase family protein [Chloroflexota bacterium]
MKRAAFERLVREALDQLPAEFRARLENIQILIKDRPAPEELASMGLGPEETLLGLYQGIPLTERGLDYNLVTPDQIILYLEPIEEVCESEEEIRREVRATVIHEIGHFFGIDDERLEELEAE